MEKLFDYTVPKCLVFPPDEYDDEENDAIFECASTVEDVENVENARYQLVDVGNSPDLRELKPEEQMEQSLGTKKKTSTLLNLDGPDKSQGSCKKHKMLTRLDRTNSPVYCLRSRNVERSLSPASKVMNTNSSKKNVTKKTSQPSCCQPKLILELTALIGSRKRKHSPYSEQPRKYISLAEAALSFQRCTPRRFDSRKTSREPTPYKPWLFEPTIQVTPNLTSRLRTRLVHYPTWDQEEEQMKKRLEKAFPLYTDIFKQPKLGIRVEVKQHTTPEPFNLTELEEKEVLQSPQFALQAWPISKGIMENVKGIPEKKPSLATKRFAPKLIKRRIPLKVSEDSVELIDGKTGLKPQEVFNIGVPQVCNERSTPSKRITEVKPFSFEKRDIEIQKKKDEKIKASQDESMKFTFRARPAKVLNQKPFVPKPADRSPLIPVDLVLNTETRSKIREEFNQYLKERDEHIEQLRAEVSRLKHT